MFYLNGKKTCGIKIITDRKKKAFPTEMEQKEILWKKSMTMKTEANPVKEKKIVKEEGK